MKSFHFDSIKKSERIDRLKANLFKKMPEIEADRAILLTESYKMTEGLPIIKRRSHAFSHILKNIPVTIREDETDRTDFFLSGYFLLKRGPLFFCYIADTSVSEE